MLRLLALEAKRAVSMKVMGFVLRKSVADLPSGDILH